MSLVAVPQSAPRRSYPLTPRSHELLSKLTLLDALILLIFGSGAAWIYRGFFFPDPFFYEGPHSGGLRLILWGIYFGFPLVALLVAALFVGLRTGLIPGSVLLLALGGSLLGALLVYLPVSHYYYAHAQRIDISRYHPYLQIAPPPLPIQRSGSQRTVLFLGGSTTEWRNSAGKDWPSMVEEALSKSDTPITALNAAREWYTSLHSLINYSVNLRTLQPDVIVVMHAVNDLLHNADFSYLSGGPFSPDYRHFYGPLSRALNRPSLFGTIGQKLGSAWYHRPREIIATRTFPGLQAFTRNLRTLIELASLQGSTVVLLAQPNLLRQEMPLAERAMLTMLNQEAIGPRAQWNLATAVHGFQQYNDGVRTLAAEGGARLLDLEREVPKSPRYFTDEVHYTDAAYPVVASAVARELAEILKTER